MQEPLLISSEIQEGSSFPWHLLMEATVFLWKDWPKDMMIATSLGVVNGNLRFSLSGECPHCGNKAVFGMVGQPTVAPAAHSHQLIASIMQCPGCLCWILAVVHWFPGSGETVRYHLHYPVGKPNENLDKSIPQDVAEDFKEAIRCHAVKAFRACVVMCRRAIQTSVLGKSAQGNTLVQQIDDLATKGTITQPLKEFAHEIRLTGNVGAHSDGLEDVEEEDADDVMAFTDQYLEHVYVMPERLKARKAAAAPGGTPKKTP